MAILQPTDFIKVVADFVKSGDKTIPVTAEIGVDLVADFVPYSKLTFDRTYRTLSNQYVLPRGIRMSENIVKTSFDLKGVIEPELAEGGADAIQLTKQMGFALLYSQAELRGWYANSGVASMNSNDHMKQLWQFFGVEEAKRNIDIVQEKDAIKTISDESTANFVLAYKSDHTIDGYQTLLNIAMELSDKGVSEYNTKVYISNDFYGILMKDGVIIANGQSSIQSSDVRFGLDHGKGEFPMVDLILIRDPIVKNVTKNIAEEGQPANNVPALCVICPEDNLFLIYNEVQPLAFLVVPQTYRINSLQMQYFRYYRIYIKDKSVTGVLYKEPDPNA